MACHNAQTIPQHSLPKELYEKLETLVKSEKEGYVSVSDAVKDAVRELLRKHKLLP